MQNKNRTTLVLLLAAFVIPVILAKLALDYDYFNKAATNKGVLLTPPQDVSTMYRPSEPKWQVMYLHQGQCDSECDYALYSISQVWSALGKRRDRVESMVISERNDSINNKLSGFPVLRPVWLADSPNPAMDQGIYIVDTQSHAVLFYSLVESQEDAVMMARDMLQDLRKLLKLSRIG